MKTPLKWGHLSKKERSQVNIDHTFFSLKRGHFFKINKDTFLDPSGVLFKVQL